MKINPYESPSRYSADEERKSMLNTSSFDDISDSLEDLHPAPQPRSRKCGLALSLAGNLLLFVVILFQLAHPCYFSARKCVYEKRGADGKGVEAKLMGDVNGIVPEFPPQKVVFMNDSHYSNDRMFKDEKQFKQILKRWKDDMPLGRGFIVVNNSAQYPGLSRPWHLSSVPGDGYSIAYLHQYHCLYMIMKSLGDSRFNHPEHDADMERHVTHCFDYLRQSMYCAGDATLEGKSATEGLDMTDGWGDTHVCKDQTKLRRWVLDKRFSNKTGID